MKPPEDEANKRPFLVRHPIFTVNVIPAVCLKHGELREGINSILLFLNECINMLLAATDRMSV